MKKIIIAIILLIILGTAGYFLFVYFTTDKYTYTSIESPVEVRIPVNNKCLVLHVPKRAILTSTDGISFWEFTDNEDTTTIRVGYSKISTDILERDGLYLTEYSVTREFDNSNFVTVSDTSKRLQDAYDDLQKGLHSVSYTMTKENAISLPYLGETNETKLTEIGIYMPTDYRESIILKTNANVKIDGIDFIVAMQKLKLQDEVVNDLASWLAVMSSSGDLEWYVSSDTIYLQKGDVCCGARRLTLNNWAALYSTTVYKDVLLKTLNAPHGAS